MTISIDGKQIPFSGGAGRSWQRILLDITSYRGKSITLSFTAFSNRDTILNYIDDVEFYDPSGGPSPDVGPWYASPNGNDTNRCNQPNNPCKSINGVLDKSGVLDGDTLYLEQGRYIRNPGPDEIALLNKSVRIYGGWDSTFTEQIGKSTIDGRNYWRGITVPLGVTAYLENMIIQNGYNASQGGGVLNSGDLTIFNSMIDNNQAGSQNIEVLYGGSGGGIYNTGTLSINSSTISNNRAVLLSGCCFSPNGGGIFNFNTGRVTIQASNIAGNLNGGIHNTGSATLEVSNSLIKNTTGNGIENNSVATITGSMISENSNTGLSNSGTVTLLRTSIDSNKTSGVVNAGTLAMDNCTVASNAKGGVINNGGTASINSSNVIYNLNEYGLRVNNGTVSIRNSIFAKNLFDSSVGADVSGLVTNLGYNLVMEGSSEWDSVKTDTDLSGDPQIIMFFSIGPQNVHPVKRTSPVINAGNPNGCLDHAGDLLTVDQLNRPRIGICDIGAYEFNPDAPQDIFVFLPLMMNYRISIANLDDFAP